MPVLTKKGQVTIPKKIRDVLGILPGDEIEVKKSGTDKVVIAKKVNHAPFDHYVGYLTQKHDKQSDEIVNQLRGEAYLLLP